MKAHEVAKKLGMSNKEFLEETGLKHHMNEVPSEIAEQYLGEEKKIEQAEPQETQTVDRAETVSVDVLPDGVTPEEVWHACTGIGNRHPLWKYKSLGKKPEK